MTLSYRDSWKVTVTYIGTMVGAGFASGQEILKFFSSWGISGIIGVILSTVLFVLGGILLLGISNSLQLSNYKEIILHICGLRLGSLLEAAITIFLFATLSVMLAGSGAVLTQQIGIPFWLGIAVTVALTIFTVLYGIKGIVRANVIVVPIMAVGCVVIGLFVIDPGSLTTEIITVGINQLPSRFPSTIHWSISSLLYVAYNLTLSAAVLVPLGKEIKPKPALILGAILGGLGLGFLAFVINLAILTNISTAANCEIPMLTLAGQLGHSFQFLYAFVLWAEIFTTIIGNIYGLTTRLAQQFNCSYKGTLLILMLLAISFSLFGFSNLVNLLYPLFGYISLVFLLGLFTKPFRNS